MQFRLTKNFAKDCKIKKLSDPENKTHPLDDWFIDYLYAPRKKVAIITHAKTAFTFFISYEEAGGARFIPDHFKKKLIAFFNRHSLPQLATEVDALFSEGITYTKTVDRRVLGHINDFVRCAQAMIDNKAPFDCEFHANDINNMPTNAGSKNASYPIERFNELLGIEIPKRKSVLASIML
jgi:hypothetical protein